MSHWYDCTDIDVFDDDGVLIYRGPKFLRCMANECQGIVTQGMIEEIGKCGHCGFRKTRSATKLSRDEVNDFLTGKYPLNEWEHLFVGDDSI